MDYRQIVKDIRTHVEGETFCFCAQVSTIAEYLR